MRGKIAARVLTLAAAISLAVSTTCVTAMADDTRIETLIPNGQMNSEDGLYVLLTKDNHNKLLDLATDTVPFVNNTMVYVRLDAERVKDAVLPPAIASAEPLLVGKLQLTTQVDNGSSKTVAQIGEAVMITLQLPSEMERGSYYISILDGSTPVSAADLDEVPNTITFETADFGSFVVTGNAVTAPKPAEPAPAAPAAPVVTTPTTGTNPKAGGVMDSYAPRTVLGQAVPISMPIPTAPARTGFSDNMAATSMMMTAAFVSGTIDYENSLQDEQSETQETPEEHPPEDSFDEDDEAGIEEELEGFREVHYYR